MGWQKNVNSLHFIQTRTSFTSFMYFILTKFERRCTNFIVFEGDTGLHFGAKVMFHCARYKWFPETDSETLQYLRWSSLWQQFTAKERRQRLYRVPGSASNYQTRSLRFLNKIMRNERFIITHGKWNMLDK